MKNIRQNLFLAFPYNAVSVPVAAGVLYPLIGVLISPIWASAAMTFSSVSVIVNALLAAARRVVTVGADGESVLPISAARSSLKRFRCE